MKQLDDGVIFINYRRSDAGWPADHLADKLRAAFGEDRVFLDVRSIEAGDDFPDKIGDHLKRATVLLVLVGKQWLFVQDEFGRRRLDKRNDWVRREIRKALAHKNCRVIPVLIDDAQLPTQQGAIPRDISSMLKLQRISIRQSYSEHDLDRLICEIVKSGFRRLPAVAGESGGFDSLPGQTAAIQLRTSKRMAEETLKLSIKRGKILFDKLQKSPPSSPEQLGEQSKKWHSWRQSTEQSMRELFSSLEPLHWLMELKPRHLDFEKPWKERARHLHQDIEKEISFFQNLLQRLGNYESIQ